MTRDHDPDPGRPAGAPAPARPGRPGRPGRFGRFGRFGIIAPHVTYFLGALALLLLTRAGLLAWQRDRCESIGDVVQVFVNGLRMDTIFLSYSVAPAFLLTLVTHRLGFIGRGAGFVVRSYLTILLTLVAFGEIVTPSFILEYDARPNRNFVEYLVHPREVSAMLLGGYKLEMLLATVLMVAVSLGAWRLFGRAQRPDAPAPLLLRLALLVVLGPLLFLGARSSLGHRPANPSSVAFSNDHLINDFCLSSVYSVAYAAQQMKDEEDASEVYGKLESEEAVFDVVRAGMHTVAAADFVSDELPTLHRQLASREYARPKNLVIILEESLGAQFVPELGGLPITQFLGTLKQEGWWFDRLYATGTRSVRGIEAVISGFLPTPARSVVKLGMSQSGFFTMAELLGGKGYRTQFFYGGESHFDNMRRFFLGNGFQEIIDRPKLDNVTFDGAWGACDEDIFNKAHETFEAQSKADGQPFYSVIFSVSNHTPFDYPAGGFELVDEEPATLHNAVRYADYALGKFFEKARASSYWDDTVFLVVADHDARVHGASLVPIRHFHIPAVIVGAGVEPFVDTRLASQFDLPTTLLSLIGVSSVNPMIGYDLTRRAADAPGRAIVQYGRNQAYLTDESALVLQPHKEPTQFDWTGPELVPEPTDPELARRALAHALLPSLLYKKKLYRVPEKAANELNLPVQ